MSALHQLLARAEAHAADRAAEVANVTRHREQLKEVEKAAVRDHRQALGLVVRLRGVIEAAVILPEQDEPEAAEPVFVAIPETPQPESALPFTPALDYPDSHPIEIPKRVIEEPVLPVADALPEETHPEPSNMRQVPLTAAMLGAVQPPTPIEPSLHARPAKPNGGGIRKLADAVLDILEGVRLGTVASVEMDDLYKQTGKSASAVKNAIADLEARSLIRRCKSAERGHLTVVMKTSVEQAA